MSSSNLRVTRCAVKGCNNNSTSQVCYHDDGYENRKYANFCSKHLAEYTSGKLRNW